VLRFELPQAMNIRKHLKLFITASAAWLVFWLTGLPDYYKQYSDTFKVWFVLLLLPPIAWLCVLALRRVHKRRRLSLARWLAFYFTVPLAMYDWLYCGLYRGYGLSFFVEFWYLTVYYFIPWILLLVSAVVLNNADSKSTTDNSHKADDIPN
jgi:hypothetical protein